MKNLMKKRDHREKPKWKFTKPVKILVFLFACVLLAFLVLHLLNSSAGFLGNTGKAISNMIFGKEGEMTTISKSSLEKVFEISELSTSDYTYNAIATAYDEDGETVRYYVAYDGTVTAGIDFNKVDITVDKEKKCVRIKLPESKILKTTVDFGSIEYIFKKDKYDTETVSQEAYKLCEDDLNKRAEKEKDLLSLANENAKTIVEAMIRPWIQQLDEEYTIDIQ
ncbi:MAG: DUF4230 domain-containing protein [Lachnospiraceae bacterium]|nr:DUF4230 domain-containing protein [Lachnospiraceae bacterium]